MEVLTRSRILRLFLVAALLPAAAAGSSPKDAQVRAGVLYNLSRFVEWPRDAFTHSPDLVICLSGGNPLGQLAGELTGRRVTDRAIRVMLLDGHDRAQSCHMLFVSDSSEQHIAAILQRVGNAPVLTVGEANSFALSGGVVRLYLESGRVRFQINAARAKEVGLRISSRILALASIVRSAGVSSTESAVADRYNLSRSLAPAPERCRGVMSGVDGDDPAVPVIRCVTPAQPGPFSIAPLR